ncbi:HlyD family efflux transporter periplasmic adaptor subunit [Thiomicrorhabdus sp. ZW0627]|uniref:efflux RND transporter periplasmic adaptor subunit n=1 Tax=Thiomicrorhabdus sp. ZW0627 TaxID=3039774 RepID=UPI00243689E2|nr:HlyD family efflux transporter periplasmic adaptor subunit [Thiomicrorhabdus sp. ZW0627]MDG6773172.1 HlyD family efflux transporter periplasmic adaptor subunit [Thiomicrorhabdus sp. ZW0627]
MQIPLRNHPGILVVSALIIALLIWGFWPQPVLIESTTVKRGPLTVTVEKEGRTRVIDRYVISAPVNGMTCRMHLKVGDLVAKGETLLGITPLESQVLDSRSRAQAEAQVSAAKSALQAAKEQALAANADAKLASDKVKRYKPLIEKGLVSQETYDQARTESLTATAAKRSADFNVEVANYELQAALTVLEYSAAKPSDEPVERVPVKSPIDGRILKVARKCEGPVTTGESLLEVGDPTALEVEVDVLSADAVKIKPGMKVLFDRWGGEETLEGIVRNIEPVGFTKVSALGVEEQRVLVISDFTSPQEEWHRLGDGYRVEAKFLLWHEDNVLQVPISALFRYKDGWAVFAVEDDHAKLKTVTLGERNGLTAQILTGLKEGEKIINHPSDTVEDGVSLKERLS